MRRILAVIAMTTAGLVLTAGPAHAVDPPLPDVTQVEGGTAHTCAVAAGAAWCWGLDTSGQVGNGPGGATTLASRVLDISGSGQLTGVTSISAGGAHSCARLTSGQVRCWGANAEFQLGNGTTTPSDHPVIVLNAAGNGPLTGVTQVTAGDAHTCALLTSGQVRCWGRGNGGQLGNGGLDDEPLPQVVRTASGVLTGVRQVQTAFNHTCARRSDRTVRCWGANEVGRIGDGSTQDRRRAATVLAVTGSGPLTGVAHVTTGGRHSCAVLTNGQVRCWGDNAFDQLGTAPGSPDTALRPKVVRSRDPGRPALTGARSVSGGSVSTCALLRNGQVRCFGSDLDGQAGDGVRTGRVGPVAVLSATGAADPPTPGNLTGITQLGGGGEHVCVRRSDGRALCWGKNEDGQNSSGQGVSDRLRPTSVLAPP